MPCAPNSNTSTLTGVSTAYRFPDRLRALQLQVHRVRAQYERHCRELPWSVEPMIGRTYERPLMGSVIETVTYPDSPGYTLKQLTQDKRLRRRLLRLSMAVVTHEWWATLPPSERVDARMALKQLRPDTNGDHTSVDERA